MQLAPIVPIANLGHPYVRAQKYQLCLAHLYLEYAQYRRAYQEMSTDGKHHVILDNSVHELRTPLDFETLKCILAELGPQEVVLPDFIDDAEATYTSGCRRLEALADSQLSVMFVPQGRNLKEWLDCLLKFCRDAEAAKPVIGLTRYKWLQGQSRALLADIVLDMGLSVHLLGCYRLEVGRTYRLLDYGKERLSKIRSMDTAKPFVPHLGSRPSDYFTGEGIDPDLLKRKIWDWGVMYSGA